MIRFPTLLLVPDDRYCVTGSALNESFAADPASDGSAGNLFVYGNKRYRFELHFDGAGESTLSEAAYRIFLNGRRIEANAKIQGSDVILTPENQRGRGVFSESIGYVRITVQTEGLGLPELQSKNFLVLIPKNPETRRLRNMAAYVADRKPLLSSGEPGSGASETFARYEVTLSRLKTLAALYSRYAGYFRNSPQKKTETEYRWASVEKLRNFGAKTLQSTVSHPEELTLSLRPTGIRVGHGYYLPKHALVENISTSSDTYENRMLIAFLARAEKESRRLAEALRNFSESDGSEKLENTDRSYFSSASIMLLEARGRCRRIIGELEPVSRQLGALLALYGRILRIPVSLRPEPLRATQTFLKRPVYRLFFNEFSVWNRESEPDFRDGLSLYRFLASSRLYEYYVLLRLIEDAEKAGYVRCETERFVYGFDQKELYENSDIANTYRFKNAEGGKLTIWYQPVIYAKTPGVNGIELRRITSLCLREGSGMGLADIYSPDFILCAEGTDGVRRYRILDAKYSRLCDVRAHSASEVAFKYLLSVRPSSERAQLEGLTVVYGKAEWAEAGTPEEKSLWDYLPESEENPEDPFFRVRAVFGPLPA